VLHRRLHAVPTTASDLRMTLLTVALAAAVGHRRARRECERGRDCGSDGGGGQRHAGAVHRLLFPRRPPRGFTSRCCRGNAKRSRRSGGDVK
jgi:hypothetical protein